MEHISFSRADTTNPNFNKEPTILIRRGFESIGMREAIGREIRDVPLRRAVLVLRTRHQGLS